MKVFCEVMETTRLDPLQQRVQQNPAILHNNACSSHQEVRVPSHHTRHKRQKSNGGQQRHQRPTPKTNGKPENITLTEDAARLYNAACAQTAALNISGESEQSESLRNSTLKTPVSILQEILSRQAITPKYELVQIEGAIHEPVFSYRVFISDELLATGTGRSKKTAKHAAASNLLDIIMGKASDQESSPPSTSTTLNTLASQPMSPFDDQVMGNPIGWLQEMCVSRKWPPPVYTTENEEGMPHERQYAVVCKVLKYVESGMGNSKKLAKKMAAHKMWQKLQDISGDEKFELDASAQCTQKNTLSPYKEIRNIKLPRVNSAYVQKVQQFHKHLRQATGILLDQLQVVNISAVYNLVKYLEDIANEQKFEVTYIEIDETSTSDQFHCLVQLSTLPVAVCFGNGITMQEAKQNASRNALEYLRILTRH